MTEKTKAKETLDMQVHRLLGKCWHEFPEDEIFKGSMVSTCLKCKKTFFEPIWTLAKIPLNYTSCLDMAWECVEYIGKHCKLDTWERFMEWFSIFGHILTFKKPALAICKAFVYAMGEKPAPLSLAA